MKTRTKAKMKTLLLICAGLLLLAIADMPIGYYTFLRIVVTIGAVAVVVYEFENGFNFWLFAFGFIAIFFNPLVPVYLNDKDMWMPIDFAAAILFGIKSFSIKKNES